MPPEAGIAPSSLPSAPSIGAILLQILFCLISESLPLLLAACTRGEYSSHPLGSSLAARPVSVTEFCRKVVAAVPEWDLPESAGTSAFSLSPQMGKAQQLCEKTQLQAVRVLSVRTRAFLCVYVPQSCVLRCIHATVCVFRTKV